MSENNDKYPIRIGYITEIEGITIQGDLELSAEEYQLLLELEKQYPDKGTLELIPEVRKRINQ